MYVACKVKDRCAVILVYFIVIGDVNISEYVRRDKISGDAVKFRFVGFFARLFVDFNDFGVSAEIDKVIHAALIGNIVGRTCG